MSSEIESITSPAGLHVGVVGEGPRVVLIHGNMVNAARTWKAQLELAADWTLVLPDRRGFSPNPGWNRCDFRVDADDIAPLLSHGTHIVAHSYGCMGALWIAAAHPAAVASLTLIEPPAHRLALDDARVAESIAGRDALNQYTDPEEFMVEFTRYVGGDPSMIRLPLDEVTLQHALVQMDELLPWALELPIGPIAAAGIPALIVTGGHSEVFELVADRLDGALAPNSERVVLEGAGHAVQRLGARLNTRLAAFWTAASSH